jgi:D-alanyl-lipoteichoic acid acyltransferase DltB (MBOAT superfamily)
MLTALARRLLGPLAAQIAVLIASIAFYGWYKPSLLLYLGASVLVNFALAQAIGHTAQPRRKWLLRLALALNIACLCVFKYSNFALSIAGSLTHHAHPPLDLPLPLGISFFTLAQIMYLVDTYDGDPPPMGLLDHATFASFFPYVVSGPIARAKRMQHQFGHFGGGQPGYADSIARGLIQFAIGMGKKTILADTLSQFVAIGFGDPKRLSVPGAWVFSLMFSLQIYFDFSGYSDMAIGSARMLGITVPRNFDAPFRSNSVTEFWQRWHITLTEFITTYLYTPIMMTIGNISLWVAAPVTILVMLIAGFWHGAAWTFGFFGLIHGVGLAVNQVWRRKKLPKPPKWLSWVLTMLTVNFAFVVFNSPSLPTALTFLLHMVDPRYIHGEGLLHLAFRTVNASTPFAVAIVAISPVLAIFGRASDTIAQEMKLTATYATAIAVLLCISLFYSSIDNATSFVYFKF